MLSILVNNWSYRFARDILAPISRTLCSVHPVKYKDILELDRKIRDFETHPHIQRPGPKDVKGYEYDLQRFHPIVTLSEKEWGQSFVCMLILCLCETNITSSSPVDP